MKTSSIFNLKIIASIIAFMITLSSYGQSAWEAPSAADKLINPLDKNEKNISKGKKSYEKLCALCHGNSGTGDGPASKGLTIPPADHTSKLVQAQSDGAIYWKISSGKELMPAYKSLLSKTERWQLTLYIRELAKSNK